MIHLYIDPGTGMIIIQLIVAAFASILMFFKKIKEKNQSLFRKK